MDDAYENKKNSREGLVNCIDIQNLPVASDLQTDGLIDMPAKPFRQFILLLMSGLVT
jgi:hypothetical protein